MAQTLRSLAWKLVLLTLVAGCAGGSAEPVPEPQQPEGLADQDFQDVGEIGDDGEVTEGDEQDDFSFEADDDTVDEDTTFTSEPVPPEELEGDAIVLVPEAGAILKVSADHEVPGALTVSLRLDTWDGSGIGGRLWGVVLAKEDGSVDFARGQELAMDETTGDSWFEFTLPGADIFTPSHRGSYIIVIDLHADLSALTTADGVEDPDVEAGGPVVSDVDWYHVVSDTVVVTGDVFLCATSDNWESDGDCEVWLFDTTAEYEFTSVCDGTADEGPEYTIAVTDLTLVFGELEVHDPGTYLIRVKTAATCAGPQPVSLGDLPGCDQGDRILVGSFGGIDTSNGLTATFGYVDGAAIVDLDDEAVELDLDYLTRNRIGAVAVSTGGALQGTQDDALVAYGNNGYGITGYDPVAGFGLTQVDPSAGSVSDVDTYEEDASRAVVVLSGQNHVAFLGHVTSQFGNYFAVGGPNGISSARFPGATGPVISAARRNETTPVYFVTVGATSDDPGQLWRKDDPADLVTPATLIGSVGNAPRRIRFAKSIGVVSNSSSDTLTILVRDASDNVTIKGTVPVGDGPIGVDLLELPDGNIGVVSAGFLDNTYTVTILEPDGDVVSNATSPVPNGGDRPSCAVWADAAGEKIAVSCSGSGEIVLIPVG